MPGHEQTSPKLPLPKWCFVLLEVPTFYMPLVYVVLAGWVIGSLLMGPPLADIPQWMYAKSLLTMGAMFGGMGMVGIFFLMAALIPAGGPEDRRALRDLLRAAGNDPRPTGRDADPGTVP